MATWSRHQKYPTQIVNPLFFLSSWHILTPLTVFWALRGGGAGSWGVIISATIRTFPTFDAVFVDTIITMNTSQAATQLAVLHASHIFDWDHLQAGHYFYLNAPPMTPTFAWEFSYIFPNTSLEVVNASLTPFLNEAAALGTSITTQTTLSPINDEIGIADSAGNDIVLGSRLISEDVFRHNLTEIGETYQKLLDAGIPMYQLLLFFFPFAFR